MRDLRFPSHKDVMEAILGWASDGERYTAVEVRNGLAVALDVTPELQEELFRPSSSMTKWENYVAHGLSWHSRPPAAHILGEDGYYRLTELGKVMANRVVDPRWRAKMEQRVDEAIAAMTAEKERPVDGDHQIS